MPPAAATRLKPFDFKVPTELHFGGGAFSNAARLAKQFGKHGLLVTSRTAMHRLGYADTLVTQLKEQRISYTCFREISKMPTTDDVDFGASIAREVEADFVIALGGGSSLDCGKAIAGVAPSAKPAREFLYGNETVGSDALPIVAIPTTAGTGSEMNKSAIVVDPKRRFKDGIRSPFLFPRVAVVDPELTHSVPKDVTAQTGFDVLAHAIESFVSPRSHPIADTLALNAMKIVIRWLPILLNDPANPEARAYLAYASTTMGINLATVGTCLPHRLDKALCALHPEISHGRSVALFYPCWAESAWRGSPDRFARIVEILNPEVDASTDFEIASMFPQVIASTLRSFGMQQNPTDLDLTSREIPMLVERVAGDVCINPVPFSKEALPQFLRRVFDR